MFGSFKTIVLISATFFFSEVIEEEPSPKANNDDRIIPTHHGQGVCAHNGYPYEGHVCTQGLVSIVNKDYE